MKKRVNIRKVNFCTHPNPFLLLFVLFARRLNQAHSLSTTFAFNFNYTKDFFSSVREAQRLSDITTLKRILHKTSS